MTMFCRVGHCSECAASQHPRKGQPFLVMGAKNDYHIYLAGFTREKGYTPHLYQNLKVSNGYIIYRKLCCICGVTISRKDNTFHIHESSWKKGMLDLRNWNALQQFRDTGYEV